MKDFNLKRLVMLMFAFIFGSMLLIKSQEPKMIVELKNGNVVEKELQSLRRLSIESNNLSLVYNTQSQNEYYSPSEISKIYFTGLSASTGTEDELSDTLKVKLYLESDVLKVENAKNCQLYIYALNGTKVLSQYLTSSQESIDVSLLQNGFYIVKAGNYTTKISKR